MTKHLLISFPKIKKCSDLLVTLQKRGISHKNVTVSGTTKIHGTNAGVVFWADGEVTFQSRRRKISIDSDNAGFAAFMHRYGYIDFLRKRIPDQNRNCVFYGEFCGEGIQSKVGVCEAPKTFVLFSVKQFDVCPDTCATINVVDRTDILKNPHFMPPGEIKWDSEGELRIFPIYEFGELLHENVSLTDKNVIAGIDMFTRLVEDDCPVAQKIAPNATVQTGEGIVWTVFSEKGERLGAFKTKGTKHQRGGGGSKKSSRKISNGNLIVALDRLEPEALTVDRLMQGLDVLEELGYSSKDMKNVGQYIKWVQKDIVEECGETISEIINELGVSWKGISKRLTPVIVDFYKENAGI